MRFAVRDLARRRKRMLAAAQSACAAGNRLVVGPEAAMGATLVFEGTSAG